MAHQEHYPPRAAGRWQSLVQESGLLGVSIHHGLYTRSASMITLEQFLLLRILWNDSLDASRFSAQYWIDPECLSKAKQHLRHEKTCWAAYLASIEKAQTRFTHGDQFRGLGTYAPVRHYQRLLFDVEQQPALVARPKLTFSPIKTRSQRAAEEAAAAAAAAGPSQPPARPRPKTPTTPTPKGRGLVDKLAADFGGLKFDDTPGTPSTGTTHQTVATAQLSPYSPLRDDDGRTVEAVKDEQIVNFALILFLDALLMHCQEVQGEWSVHRQPFVVRNETQGKIYEARVDGYLRRHGADIRAIVEVKPYIRNSLDNSLAIRMQESAQMAAWIHQEPPKDTEACRRDKRKMTRLLVSQDRNEIYLTFAEFDAAYVDYICRGVSGPGDGPFLVMNEFGPFSVDSKAQMQVLGEALLAFAIQECS